ncbi:MAG: hypothetical protein QM594_04940 [Niabella sp.]
MQQVQSVRNIFLITVLLAMFWSSSCKKEGAKKNNEPIPLIKTITDKETGYAYIAAYTYDAQKRVVKTDDNGTINEYSYTPGKIRRTITQNANNITVFEYELNDKGLIKSLHRVGDAVQFFYEYNAEGFLIKSHDNQATQYSSTYYYNPDTGLLDSISATLGGAWHSSNVYSYYPDKANTIGNSNEGKSFLGKDGAHPVKKQTYRYRDNNTIRTQTVDFSYTFDDRGWIHSRSRTENGQTAEYFYTYYE